MISRDSAGPAGPGLAARAATSAVWPGLRGSEPDAPLMANMEGNLKTPVSSQTGQAIIP